MTDRYQHDDAYLTSPEKETAPTALWLAVIPMVVVSLIGLATGFSVLSKARADADRPLGADETATAGPAEDMAAQPERFRADRSLRPSHPLTTGGPGREMGRSTPVTTAVEPTPPAPPTTARASGSASGCDAALRWLSTHAAPGFAFECPGYALGHQAMTCVNVAGVCSGERIIAIADACPAAYMNEAHNSWILAGLTTGPLDPYGYC